MDENSIEAQNQTQFDEAVAAVPVAEEPDVPTVDQANEMFRIRPDLASVITDIGVLHRDGSLTAA